MKLYKMCIKPLASFTSPLQSDTFFGAFCWAYRYLCGEELLETFLRDNLNGNIQLVFSNAFPSGTLPLPVGVRDEERLDYSLMKKGDAKEIYQKNKKLKKYSLIDIEGFLSIQNGSLRGFRDYLRKEDISEFSTTHNMVNRSDGTVQNFDGKGNLFVRNELYPEMDTVFDVYILTSLPNELLRKVLIAMLQFGIGGSKSVGKGVFEFVKLTEENEICSVDGANGFIALSNFIPARTDPVDGWYRTRMKMGKTDRVYAAGEYPFKKPLLYIQAGAVFRTDQPKQYYGRFIENVSPIPGVVVNACTIAIPMRLQAGAG